MVNKVRTFNIKTRKSEEDKVGTMTALTIDYTGATEEQILAHADAQVKVRVQQHFRKHGIPKTFTVKVADLASGGMGLTPEQVQASAIELARTDPKVLAALQKQLAELVGKGTQKAA